jgi:FKBP-type peptidyl-prolyl cis-trans isomerase FkpA
MIKVFCLLFFCFLITGQNLQAQFIPANNGIIYKIISSGTGKNAKQGDFLELHTRQVYQGVDGDTILYDSWLATPVIAEFDSAIVPAPYYDIFSGLAKGDSVVIKQLTDSIMVQNSSLPTFIKKGDTIKVFYKLVNIHTSRQSANEAQQANLKNANQRDSVMLAAQHVKDDAIIQAYLNEKNIKTIRAPLGTYVQIIEQGTGPFAAPGKKIKVFYTGKTIPDEKAFDSNTDSTFGHTEVLTFSISKPGQSNSVIKGWEDGFSLLQKGAVAKLFIPSVLAYGKSARGELIRANQCMYFDIRVVDVFTEIPPKKKKTVKLPQKRIKKK